MLQALLQREHRSPAPTLSHDQQHARAALYLAKLEVGDVCMGDESRAITDTAGNILHGTDHRAAARMAARLCALADAGAEAATAVQHLKRLLHGAREQ